MINKCVRLFHWMMIALGVSALCLFIIPLVQEQTPIQYTLAAIFWVSLLTEMILLVSGNHMRKKIEKISPHMKQKPGFGKLGIFCFAQNQEAKIVDGLLAASIVYLIAISMLQVNSVWLVIIAIVGVYLMLQMHCILNGILYKSIKYYKLVIHKRREQK